LIRFLKYKLEKQGKRKQAEREAIEELKVQIAELKGDTGRNSKTTVVLDESHQNDEMWKEAKTQIRVAFEEASAVKQKGEAMKSEAQKIMAKYESLVWDERGKQ
jgi:hypothetical protein